VADKATKDPFPRSLGVANTVYTVGLSPAHGISLYPGTGTVDGVIGDHAIIAPAYTTTVEEARIIAGLTRNVVFQSMKEVCKGCRDGTC
jgi:hypothetical protein